LAVERAIFRVTSTQIFSPHGPQVHLQLRD